ncbi:hypothetical protein [Paenilisteria newyorkensis]|uniref:hypothetical protein n=1 Tax=Listeria newyorkensis TaxID=1497681 RepID=UPI00235892DC|nr:hypothetical protein [Listeria newyorkensis]WAO20411.1 hypothetical protein OTR81_08820 [Listeria newyorkensis]
MKKIMTRTNIIISLIVLATLAVLIYIGLPDKGVIAQEEWDSVTTEMSSVEVTKLIGKPLSETSNRNDISRTLEGYSTALSYSDDEKYDVEKFTVTTLLQALSEKKNVKVMTYKIKSVYDDELKEVEVYFLNDESVYIN